MLTRADKEQLKHLTAKAVRDWYQQITIGDQLPGIPPKWQKSNLTREAFTYKVRCALNELAWMTDGSIRTSPDKMESKLEIIGRAFDRYPHEILREMLEQKQ